MYLTKEKIYKTRKKNRTIKGVKKQRPSDKNVPTGFMNTIQERIKYELKVIAFRRNI